MYIQKVYLKKDFPVISGNSDVFDVPRTDPLAGILLRHHITTGAGGSAAFADEALIELIKNGSEVITSVQFGQLIAVCNLIHRRLYKIADLGASATGYYLAFIPFGRSFPDPEYFLDPRGFASLELKVKQPTIATTTTQNMDAILLVLRACSWASKGYFKISTKKAYNAAAAIEYVELDRANKYAAIIAGEMDGVSTDILSVLGNVKLNLDAGKVIPLDEVSQDLFDEVSLQSGVTLAADPSAPTIATNFLAAQWLKPWLGEEALLDAPGYGKVVAEITGLAAGAIRVTGVELVKA